MQIFELFFQSYFYFPLLMILIFLAVSLPVGFLLVHKNMGLFSDALSHSMIPGLVLSLHFLGSDSQSYFIGAFFWCTALSLVFALLKGMSHSLRDSLIVALSLFGLSLGLILVQLMQVKIDVAHLLFGSPLLITSQDLYPAFSLSVICLVLLKFYWKTLILYCIDPHQAELKYGRFKVHFVFSFLTCTVVIIGFQSFGILLTSGLLILPHLIFSRDKSKVMSHLFLTYFGAFLVAFLSYFISFMMQLTYSATFIFLLATLSLVRLLINQVAKN